MALFLIVFLPLFASLVVGFFGKKLGNNPLDDGNEILVRYIVYDGYIIGFREGNKFVYSPYE